jgi:hypothetical protein
MEQYMKRFLNFLMIAVLAVVFVLPATACGEKISKLNITLAIYDVEDEKTENVTLSFDLYDNLAPDAVSAVKTWVKDGYYNGLVFYQQSKYINQSTSSQIMYGGYKLVDGVLTQNSQKLLESAEFEKNGTIGSNLTNVKGAIGLWRDWAGDSNYKNSGYGKTNSTLYIPTTSLTSTYDGYFCLLGKYSASNDLAIIEQIVELMANTDYYTKYTCYYEADEDGTLKLVDGNPVWKSMLTEDFDDATDLPVYKYASDATASATNPNTGYESYTVSILNADKLMVKSISVK